MKPRDSREFLVDVSRLLWRLSTGRLPTGIDRVVLQYFEHFGSRSQAVIQYKGRIVVLSPSDTDRLVSPALGSVANFKAALLAFAPGAWFRSRRAPPRPGMTYLNMGHTGLDELALGTWIRRHGIRAVFLIHDLIPITHPQFCRAGEDSRHAERMRVALSSASGIVGNSRATLDEIAAFARRAGLAVPPMVAALLGGPDLPSQIPNPGIERPYFVALGTIEGRKNHILLLKVWKQLIRRMGAQAPLLVIIGQRGWEAEPTVAILDDLGELAPHVLELNHCGDDELAGWLAGARALLMPSFVEGFGLPVIEALELGTPVIAADLPVYSEIAGDIPLYLDPSDEAAWQRAIEEFAGDSVRRSRQVEAVRQYRAPDWQSHFATVEAFLAQVRPS